MFRLSSQQLSFDGSYNDEGVTDLLRDRVATERESNLKARRFSRGAQAVRMGHRRVTSRLSKAFPIQSVKTFLSWNDCAYSTKVLYTLPRSGPSR